MLCEFFGWLGLCNVLYAGVLRCLWSTLPCCICGATTGDQSMNFKMRIDEKYKYHGILNSVVPCL